MFKVIKIYLIRRFQTTLKHRTWRILVKYMETEVTQIWENELVDLWE